MRQIATGSGFDHRYLYLWSEFRSNQIDATRNEMNRALGHLCAHIG